MSASKVACYLRVSSQQQRTASQRPEIERWLKGNGHKPGQVRWYEDHESGKDTDRPAFQEMQKAIFNGEIDTVVVWKLDRLSRSMRDGVNLVYDLCDKGIRVVVVTSQLDLGPTHGKIIAALLFGLAQIDREHILERQAAGIAIAKGKGVYKGKKPGAIKGRKQGQSTDKVAKVAELYRKGVAVVDICKSESLSRNTVYKYLGIARGEGMIA